MSPPPTIRIWDLPPWGLHRGSEASDADCAPMEGKASVNKTTRQTRETWKALKPPSKIWLTLKGGQEGGREEGLKGKVLSQGGLRGKAELQTEDTSCWWWWRLMSAGIMCQGCWVQTTLAKKLLEEQTTSLPCFFLINDWEDLKGSKPCLLSLKKHMPFVFEANSPRRSCMFLNVYSPAHLHQSREGLVLKLADSRTSDPRQTIWRQGPGIHVFQRPLQLILKHT